MPLSGKYKGSLSNGSIRSGSRSQKTLRSYEKQLNEQNKNTMLTKLLLIHLVIFIMVLCMIKANWEDMWSVKQASKQQRRNIKQMYNGKSYTGDYLMKSTPWCVFHATLFLICVSHATAHNIKKSRCQNSYPLLDALKISN